MKNIIINNFKDYNIKVILKVGSALFSDKPNDLDYLCIADDIPKATRVKINHDKDLLDVLVLNETEYFNKINFIDTKVGHSLYNYQLLLAEVIYIQDDYVIPQFDMFNQETKETYLRSIAFNYIQTLGKSIQKHFYSKMFTHYFIIIEFYKNNSAELTDDILSKVKALREKEAGYGKIIDEVDEYLFSYEQELINHIYGEETG